MNALMTIQPYRHGNMWVFDDAAAGLEREPFVSGVPEMIDRMVRDIPHAEDGFQLIFSAGPFPGAQVTLEWLREEFEGNWYRWAEGKMEGWLCPALFKYFDKAPARLFAKVEAIGGKSLVLRVPRAAAEELLELLEAGRVEEAREMVRGVLR